MEFQLLGPLDVVERGRSLLLGGRKQRALLAVLLLHANEVVSRERLIDELWGGAPPATVAKSVHVYVSRLRKQLGEDRLFTRAPGYMLRVEHAELDADRFEGLVAEATLLGPQRALELLREALALWRGPAFGELAYERFAQPEVARLEELRLVALERRLDADLACGHHADVVGELEALVAEYPLREGLQGRLMLALYRCGRQAEALAAFATARSTLVDELGIEPGRGLRELHQGILMQDRGLDLAAPRPADPRRPAFVGREPELADLARCFEAAASGSGRLVLLTGEPGIGKSRLVEEVVVAARARGAQVLVGRCWEAGGAPAYWPWTQALRRYVRGDASGAVAPRLGAQAADLAQILPELRDPAHVPPAEPDGARVRLFDATAGLLRQIAAERPTVLVLDDLHAADQPSLLLLRFVARELGPMGLLVVGAYRDVSPVPGPALVDLLAELTREPVTRRMALCGLSEAEVARYVELTAAGEPAGELAADLYETTDGNPLFVGELVRLLAAGRAGTASREDSRPAIPQSVRDVIGRRLGYLSPACLRAARLACVLGREFPVEALARMHAGAEEELLDALDEAIAERILTEVPGAPGRLRFEHILIRDTLDDGLGAVRRLRLHELAATALEQLHGAQPGPHLAEVARHAVAARDAEKGQRYASAAAAWAIDQLAYEEAARLLRLGLEALELRQPVDPAPRSDLLLAIGDALAKAGDTPEAKVTFLTASDVARTAGLSERLARAALGYGGSCHWQRAGDDRRLVPLLEEALSAVGRTDSPVRAQLLARMAGALRDMPSLEPRATLSAEAVAMARRLGDADTLAYALVARFMAVWGPEIEALVPLADEVSALARDSGAADRALDALTLQSIIAWTMLGQADTSTLDDEYGSLAAQLKQPIHQWQGAMVSAASALFRGELVAAERLMEEARDSGHARSPDADCSYRLAIIVLRREQGRLAEIEPLVRESVAAIPGYRAFPCFVALLECELGRAREARLAFDTFAAGEFAALPRDGEWLFCLSLLSEVAATLADTRAAAVLYRLLLPYAHLNAMAAGEVAIGSVARYLGLLAATTGQWDEAERQLEDAIVANQRMGARPWLAHAREELARVLLARDRPGDRRRAGKLLAAATSAYRELGMAHRVIRRSGSGAEPRAGGAGSAPRTRSRAP